MKKLLSIILLLSLSVAFYSCGGDMEEEMKKPQEFVWNGDWNDPNDMNASRSGIDMRVAYGHVVRKNVGIVMGRSLAPSCLAL